MTEGDEGRESFYAKDKEEYDRFREQLAAAMPGLRRLVDDIERGIADPEPVATEELSAMGLMLWSFANTILYRSPASTFQWLRFQPVMIPILECMKGGIQSYVDDRDGYAETDEGVAGDDLIDAIDRLFESIGQRPQDEEEEHGDD